MAGRIPRVFINDLLARTGIHASIEGDLYGTVERIFDGGFVSSFGNVAADGNAVDELDPGAPAYQVPEGWLPDGATTVTC